MGERGERHMASLMLIGSTAAAHRRSQRGEGGVMMSASGHFDMARSMAMWVPAPSLAPRLTGGSAPVFVLHSLEHGCYAPAVVRPVAQQVHANASELVRSSKTLQTNQVKWRLRNAKLERKNQEVIKFKFRLRNAKLSQSSPPQPIDLLRACTWDKPPLDGVAWWIEQHDWKQQQANSDCDTILDSALPSSIIGDWDVDEEDTPKPEGCSSGIEDWDAEDDTPKPENDQDKEEEWEYNVQKVIQTLEHKQADVATQSGCVIAAKPKLGGIFVKPSKGKKVGLAKKENTAVIAAQAPQRDAEEHKEQKAQAEDKKVTSAHETVTNQPASAKKESAAPNQTASAKLQPASAKSSVKRRRYKGTVKYFRGSFGWVVCEEIALQYAGADVFIHKLDCDTLPKHGETVTFVLDIDFKGDPKGIEVKIPQEPTMINARDWFSQRAPRSST